MKYFFFLLPLVFSFQSAYAGDLTFDNLVGTYIPISKEIASDQNPESCNRFQSYRSQIINLKIEKDDKTNKSLGQSHVVYIRQKDNSQHLFWCKSNWWKQSFYFDSKKYRKLYSYPSRRSCS